MEVNQWRIAVLQLRTYKRMPSCKKSVSRVRMHLIGNLTPNISPYTPYGPEEGNNLPKRRQGGRRVLFEWPYSQSVGGVNATLGQSLDIYSIDRFIISLLIISQFLGKMGRSQYFHLLCKYGSKKGQERVYYRKNRGMEKWSKKLRGYCKKCPQAVYTAYTKSYQKEWGFIQRVVDDISDLFHPLHKEINHTLVPSIFGQPTTMQENQLFEMPVKIGGLALDNPVRTSASKFTTSKRSSQLLSEAIITGSTLKGEDHNRHVQEIQKKRANSREN
ncbi:unnamed protein product [Nesidiocoris tenuis]|uniref:Uncharacterized protein n=1 Tax=Nesidiocoris tenuis TaxID=355587 RepID=A0A6H5GQS7_9HEMI|nr:unnamed protein product [Nesidiocoris tenuis]